MKRATEALVKEAQKFKDNVNGDDVDLNVSDKLVGGLAQVSLRTYHHHHSTTLFPFPI